MCFAKRIDYKKSFLWYFLLLFYVCFVFFAFLFVFAGFKNWNISENVAFYGDSSLSVRQFLRGRGAAGSGRELRFSYGVHYVRLYGSEGLQPHSGWRTSRFERIWYSDTYGLVKLTLFSHRFSSMLLCKW